VNSDTVAEGVERVQRIFARSFGAWQWNSVDNRYEPAGLGWQAPQTPCSGNVRPPYVAGSNADLCGVAPVIGNAEVSVLRASGGGDHLENTGFISLSFTTNADFNQLPLRRLKVDWGDNQTSVVLGTSMAVRSNPQNPHRFFHLYSYWDLKGKDSGNEAILCENGRVDALTSETYNACDVEMRMQAKDNWSWCNAFDSGNPAVFGVFGALCDTLNDRVGLRAWTESITIEVRQ
jgi:hypothetical protein